MRSTIITGVSRGLGAALFDELFARGDRIFAVGRRFSVAQEELAAAQPDRVVLRVADLADLASLPESAELGAFLTSGGGSVASETTPNETMPTKNTPTTTGTDGATRGGTALGRTTHGGTALGGTALGGTGAGEAAGSGDGAGAGLVSTVERVGAAGAGTREIVLVHNAAVVGPIGAVGEVRGAELADSVSVNLTAPMVLTNSVLAAVGGLGDVRLDVVYISSGAAHRVIGGWGAYCATKAGGVMFFDVLAQQYAQDPRVRVANVDPGQMQTGMQADIRDYRAAGVYFPESQRWQDSFEQDRLVAPAAVARRIIDMHFSQG